MNARPLKRKSDPANQVSKNATPRARLRQLVFVYSVGVLSRSGLRLSIVDVCLSLVPLVLRPVIGFGEPAGACHD